MCVLTANKRSPAEDTRTHRVHKCVANLAVVGGSYEALVGSTAVPRCKKHIIVFMRRMRLCARLYWYRGSPRSDVLDSSK